MSKTWSLISNVYGVVLRTELSCISGILKQELYLSNFKSDATFKTNQELYCLHVNLFVNDL